MRKFLTAAVAVGALMVAAPSYARGGRGEPTTGLHLDPATTLTLIGTVDDGSVGDVMAGIAAIRKNPKAKAITLVIDSYGGYVSSGLRLITAMQIAQSQGVQFRCVVTGAAMSMAFGIYASCDERYALEYSGLLWHPIRVRISGVMTTQEARTLAARLDYYEDHFKLQLLEALDVDAKWFFKHWYAESVHHGSVLEAAAPGFLTVVTGVSGMPLESVIEIPSEDIFGLGQTDDSRLIWIAPEVARAGH